jgi:polyhydroxybutyrate depolymerase
MLHSGIGRILAYMSPRAILVVLVLLTACGQSGPPSGPANADAIGGVTAGGAVRAYLLHAPAPAPPGRLPLVLAFHGGTSTPQGMAELTGLDRLADRDGFVVVYPAGIGRSWNDGRGNTPAATQGVDDVAFVRTLLDQLEARLPIDLGRVYATGISNGAIFSERLGCELSSRISAIAPVAGSLATNLAPACHPALPVSMLAINGTADPLVPYGGGHVDGRGSGGDVISAPSAASLWRGLDGCPGAAVTSGLPDRAHDGTSVTIQSWSGCAAGAAVELYTVEGGGHTWPGGPQYAPAALVGIASRQLDAGEVIWAFLAAHPRPQGPPS